jgi:hypothetical protein
MSTEYDALHTTQGVTCETVLDTIREPGYGLVHVTTQAATDRR